MNRDFQWHDFVKGKENILSGEVEMRVTVTIIIIIIVGTRWRSWLRRCATSRNVAGSIPDGVIGIFHGYNPSGRTMALGLTQSLIEMSTGNTSWG